MTRLAHRYWLRFAGADTWRCWESNSESPIQVAVEAASEYQSRTPLTIEVRRDNTGGIMVVRLTAHGEFMVGTDAAEGVDYGT